MKFFLSMVALCVLSVTAQSALAGSGKGGGKVSTSVDVTNTNSFMDEDGDIRVWLLSESDTVPTTKGEADELESVSLPGSAMVSFTDLDGGDYILAVAKESNYQSLADEDSFEGGVNFNAAAFSIEEGDLAEYCTMSDADSDVPEISECGGGGDEGGGGNEE